ncbi:MAG TPA: hypothetical protein VLU06_04560 [Thermoanaerobaculia bacterium]|nr:hypothetical protein [Thermoanaerobaculia bacterium]
MRMRRPLLIGAILLIGLVAAAPLSAQITIGGTTYTKFLWGNQRDQGSLYNFTTVPGEGAGDNGQGTEVELLVDGKLSKKLAIHARLHSRFSQNFWTNGGGWGGSNPPTTDCVAGNCGEFDSRSNQYVKLRGVALTMTPGYSWMDTAVIGQQDWGNFDPFVIGRIRYIDRDNVGGLLFQGSALNRQLTWDAARISLFRNWQGPNFSTGTFHAQDAAYAAQMKYIVNPQLDFGGIFNWIHDIEIDPADKNFDNGLNTLTRYRNNVYGGKVGIHPSSTVDIRLQGLYSSNDTNDEFAPRNFCLTGCGYSPVIGGHHTGWAGKANVDLNDPFGIGLSFNLEGFRIGANYSSLLAARRESDVLLTEGHDATWAFPGPSNAKFGIFGGNRTVIGYGGWDGPAQQVATIAVDNEFTDFDEPMAETVIGWEGVTLVPVYSKGSFELSGEFSYITYDTNWQAFNDASRSIMTTDYPTTELDTGVNHSFRSAFAPFQDRKTYIGVVKAKYTLNVGKGLEIFGKLKGINETDNRMNDARFLPYQAGDCPGGSADCKGNKNFYSTGNTTSDLYGNPPVITVTNPVTGATQTGYQWKPFDSLSDDDRNLNYWMANVGLGYQLTNDLYGSLSYNYYHANLEDGDTAMQAYNLHEMASGNHRKNQLIARFKYNIAGISECGLEYQYNWGTFHPEFGGGYVVQYASADVNKNLGFPVGSPGFTGRFTGWNSLLDRSFDQQRLKAYIKVAF